MPRVEDFSGITQRIGVIISVDTYDKITDPNGQPIKPTLTAKEDSDYVSEQLDAYGFSFNLQRKVENPSFIQIKKTMSDIKATCVENFSNDQQTLLYFYFRGISYHDTMTYALINDKAKSHYPLEEDIRALTTEDNVYALAFFDSAQLQTSAFKFVEITPNEDANGPDLIFTHGCAAQKDTIPEYSSLARQYFEFIDKHLNVSGEFEFPQGLSGIDKNLQTTTVADGPIIIKRVNHATQQTIVPVAQVSSSSNQAPVQVQQMPVQQVAVQQQQPMQQQLQPVQQNVNQSVQMQDAVMYQNVHVNVHQHIVYQQTLLHFAKEELLAEAELEAIAKGLLFMDTQSYRGYYYICPIGTKWAHGPGIKIFKSGHSYKGNFCNGTEEGPGIFDYLSKGHYEGNFRMALYHGHGTRRFRNGDYYSGQWINGKKHGQGFYFYGTGGKYFGGWKCDKKEGFGTKYYANGARYEGMWQEGLKHGDGQIIFNTGKVYEGQWRNDKEHGNGIERYRNGDIFEGEHFDGVRENIGTYTWVSGEKYHGQWLNGKREGFGTHWYTNGNVYVGFQDKERRHGRGRMTYANGDVYDGEWHDNRKQGWGLTITAAGMRSEQFWVFDKPVARPQSQTI